MKKKIILLAYIVLSTNAYAQQDTLSSKIKEPDFPFEPVYLDSNYMPTDLPLEKFDFTTKRGIGRVAISYSIQNLKSQVRLKANTTLMFVVKQGLINGSVTKVKDMYKLFKLEVKKQTRSYLNASTNGSTMHQNNDDIPLKFKKINDDIYLLIIDNLDKGEYVIEAKVREIKLYSFGLD